MGMYFGAIDSNMKPEQRGGGTVNHPMQIPHCPVQTYALAGTTSLEPFLLFRLLSPDPVPLLLFLSLESS